MSNNTGIKIEVVKEVSDTGEQGYRITKIKALTIEKLPRLYLNKAPAVYLQNNGDLYHRGTTFTWTELNKFYSVSEMEERLTYIREAGQHLTDVNRELAEKRQTWNGRAVFIDGVQVHTDNQSTQKNEKSAPIPLAEKIAELWGDGRLLYRNNKGQIKLLR